MSELDRRGAAVGAGAVRVGLGSRGLAGEKRGQKLARWPEGSFVGPAKKPGGEGSQLGNDELYTC